ncbi:MAG: protein-glutamate O-methyltransferase CheR [Terracidiphilus sp.]|jgi:chemotaxis protein methyltransferase CheR
MTTQAQATGILLENYRILQESVFTEVGIVVEDDKSYLFESRLAPVIKQLNLCSIDELCRTLNSPGNLHVRQMVGEAMTTNETYFFRDPAQYEAIRKQLLPQLRELRGDRKKLSFWSAASSTGQEAYSLAMLLLEEGFGDWEIQILGTDISRKVVERARTGLFSQIEINRGLPATHLLKHFRRSGAGWQLSEAVCRMVRFETIDLRNSMRTLGPFDLVFCRNVMIYFDQPTKTNIIQQLHGTLFRGGWLLLGGSESALYADTWFERKTLGNMTYYLAR